MMQWNGKRDAIWLILLLGFFPGVAGLLSVVLPFAVNYPIWFWITVFILFVTGFVFVCKRAGKKDKKE